MASYNQIHGAKDAPFIGSKGQLPISYIITFMKMKKFIITITLCIYFCWGCSGTQNADAVNTETQTVSETQKIPETQQMTEAHPDAAIVSSLSGDRLSQIPTDTASEDNGDGSVKYTLNDEMITSPPHQMNSDLAESIQTILENDDYYPNVANITASDDYSLFTIYVKDGQVNTYEAMLVMSFYTVGNELQVYNGIPSGEAVTTVVYVNDSNGEVINQSDSGSMDTFSE